jgi:hypothetical protein
VLAACWLLLPTPAVHAAAHGYSTIGGNGDGLFGQDGGSGQGETFATCSSSQVPCPPGELMVEPPFTSSLFNSFRQRILTPNGSTGFIRFWIPYDALGSCPLGALCSSAESECVASPYSANGGNRRFAGLVYDIQGAEQLHLAPDVQISAGSGYDNDIVPSFPDPVYGSRSQYLAGITQAGQDYFCGVYELIKALNFDLGPDAVTQFEAFNEGEANPQYNGALPGSLGGGQCSVDPLNSCGPGYDQYPFALCGDSTYSNCGALELAGLWELAESVVTQNDWPDAVAAYTGFHPQNSSYLTSYVQQLRDLELGGDKYAALWPGQFPRYWSVHDYDDVTGGLGTADLSHFVSRLPSSPTPQVWVTESAVYIQDRTSGDANGSSACGAGMSFGACAAGNTAVQTDAANVWKDLGDIQDVTEVYWYGFDDVDGGGGTFDSALVSKGAGQPFTTFCALVQPNRACAPNEAGDLGSPARNSASGSPDQNLSVFEALAEAAAPRLNESTSSLGLSSANLWSFARIVDRPHSTLNIAAGRIVSFAPAGP